MYMSRETVYFRYLCVLYKHSCGLNVLPLTFKLPLIVLHEYNDDDDIVKAKFNICVFEPN